MAVDTYDDEGTQECFQNTVWEDHDAKNLRKYSSSICFLTPEAFAYYLPAFMLAEINDPETADIIAEDLASHFTDLAYNIRMSEFSREEINAIVSFFEFCADRYPDGVYDKAFHEASNQVRKY